jgi:hypothetical protein
VRSHAAHVNLDLIKPQIAWAQQHAMSTAGEP